MPKTEVYSWRVSPDTKRALEAAARREGASVAALLDRIAKAWLSTRGWAEDEKQQAMIRSAALKCAGTIRGRGRDAAERVSEIVRERVRRKHDR